MSEPRRPDWSELFKIAFDNLKGSRLAPLLAALLVGTLLLIMSNAAGIDDHQRNMGLFVIVLLTASFYVLLVVQIPPAARKFLGWSISILFVLAAAAVVFSFIYSSAFPNGATEPGSGTSDSPKGHEFDKLRSE
jgi:hypothetical protein